MLGVTARATALPGSTELASLTDLISELNAADDGTAMDVLAEVLALLNSTPSLVNHLLVPANAIQLRGGLSEFMQHSIESEVAVLADRSVTTNASTSSVVDYKHVAMSGQVSIAEPALQPLPEDDTDSGSGSSGGDGGSGGSGGSDLPGGDGGSGGSSGGNGLPGDGSSGGGDGSGSSGGLPDNFDPNDPDTWPAGIDTFEELLQWLIDNPDINA
jgi:hypothetical protein